METPSEGLTIGAFAKAAGVNVETIRFYQRKGLLVEPAKPLGGIRHYREAEIARVGFIKSAQRLGFSLDEVGELLRLEDGTHCQEARQLAERKLKDIRRKLTDLQCLEAALASLVRACRGRRSNVCCPLVTALRGQAPQRDGA